MKYLLLTILNISMNAYINEVFIINYYKVI